MKKLLALIIGLHLVAPAISQDAMKYEATNVDASGQALLERWAARSGKLIKWHATGHFDISAKEAGLLSHDAKLRQASSLGEAVTAFVGMANRRKSKMDQMPYKVCLFEQGDVAAAVFDFDNLGCAPGSLEGAARRGMEAGQGWEGPGMSKRPALSREEKPLVGSVL